MIRWLILLSTLAGTCAAQDLSQVPETKLVPVTYLGGAFFNTASQMPRPSLSRNEDGTFWKFAPEQPHQAAAVCVIGTTTQYNEQGQPFKSGGSGTLVGTTGNFTLMVTNHHVAELNNGRCDQALDVILRDGTRHRARYLSATPHEDVAVYRIDRTDLPVVAVSSENPPDDAVIEVMGFGGPWHSKVGKFRPFVAQTVQSSAGAISIDAPTISGDSGSGMIWQHVLVGVNFGGPMASQTAGVSTGEGVPLVYPATSKADARFLNAYLTQICGPQGCEPLIGRPGYLIPRGDQQWDRQPRQFPGPEQFYRPDNQGQQPPQSQSPPQQYTQPQQQSPPAQPQSPICPPCPNCGPSLNKPDGTQPGCDCKPCKDGERGEQGPKGDPGKNAELTEDHINQIVEKLANDPRLKGPQGEQGPQGVGLTADAIAALKKDFLGSVTHPDIRVAVGENGKIIDTETYKSGETIVLDIAALIKAANAK